MRQESRETILRANPFLAFHLIDLQEATYHPRFSEFKSGQRVFLDNPEQPTVLSDDMARKLNQDALDEYEKNRDHLPFPPSDRPKQYSSAIFYSVEHDPEKYIEQLLMLVIVMSTNRYC